MQRKGARLAAAPVYSPRFSTGLATRTEHGELERARTPQAPARNYELRALYSSATPLLIYFKRRARVRVPRGRIAPARDGRMKTFGAKQIK